MQTLQIDGNNARKLYPSASAEFKTMLEDSFGKSFFSLKITDRVQSVEDALSIIGKKLSDVISCNDRKDVAAYKVMTEVIAVLNEEWEADYSNSNQVKYEPRFYDYGSRLVFGSVNVWSSASNVGSRLCYRSPDILRHGVKILEKYYSDFLNK